MNTSITVIIKKIIFFGDKFIAILHSLNINRYVAIKVKLAKNFIKNHKNTISYNEIDKNYVVSCFLLQVKKNNQLPKHATNINNFSALEFACNCLPK